MLAEAATCGDQFAWRLAIELIGRHQQGRTLRPIVLNAFADRSDYVVRAACEVIAG
jgi:hypothetical protein